MPSAEAAWRGLRAKYTSGIERRGMICSSGECQGSLRGGRISDNRHLVPVSFGTILRTKNLKSIQKKQTPGIFVPGAVRFQICRFAVMFGDQPSPD